MEPVSQLFSNLLTSASSSLMQSSGPGVAYSLRMDRLFGVTMAERGVSQLVSVDLQEAERLRDIA